MSFKKISLGLIYLLLALCVAPVQAEDVPAPNYARYNKHIPCVARIGRCFDATIADKPVTVIAEKSDHEKLLATLPETKTRVSELYWEVREPVPGDQALAIVTRPNAFGLDEVGDEKEPPDVAIYPMDGQDLESEKELVAQSNVRINGQAMVTQQNTLAQDYLPPGRYIFAIKYHGEKNWDRKWVYLLVK